MAFRFEDLKVWHKAEELSNEIDLLAKQFPVEERFSLASQIKRAADSVVSNIALRSSIEVVACFFLSKMRDYISEESFNKYYNEYELLCKIITKLRDSI
ncbi:MAG: four helix bundle protein [Niabella sp.]